MAKITSTKTTVKSSNKKSTTTSTKPCPNCKGTGRVKK